MKKKHKKNSKLLAILFILWGVLFIVYKKFFPSSPFDLLGSEFFQSSREYIEQIRVGLEDLTAIIDLVFIISIVLLTIALIIKSVRNKTEIFSVSLILAVGTLIFHIVIGAIGISWIFAIACGVEMLITQSKKKKKSRSSE